jgi:hypothetical protein
MELEMQLTDKLIKVNLKMNMHLDGTESLVVFLKNEQDMKNQKLWMSELDRISLVRNQTEYNWLAALKSVILRMKGSCELSVFIKSHVTLVDASKWFLEFQIIKNSNTMFASVASKPLGVSEEAKFYTAMGSLSIDISSNFVTTSLDVV